MMMKQVVVHSKKEELVFKKKRPSLSQVNFFFSGYLFTLNKKHYLFSLWQSLKNILYTNELFNTLKNK